MCFWLILTGSGSGSAVSRATERCGRKGPAARRQMRSDFMQIWILYYIYTVIDAARRPGWRKASTIML